MPEQHNKIEKYLSLVERYPHIVDNRFGGLPVITDRSTLYHEQENLYQRAEENGQPPHWYDLGVLAEDAWMIVLRDLVQFPNEQYGGYIRILHRQSQLERSGKDVVIVVKKQNKYLLIRHFRHEDRSWHWECPMGFAEKTLSLMGNAKKELLEETGLKPISIRRLDAGTDQTTYFLAVCDGEPHSVDKIEGISDYRWIDSNGLKNLIKSGIITDAQTIRAFSFLWAEGSL